MKTVSSVAAFLLLVWNDPAQATTPNWLVGCWESDDQTSKEIWVAEPDGSLIGFGVSTKGGKVGFYELLRITSNGTRKLVYTAYPSGQSPASFIAKTQTDDSITFSNASHDYPQQISYRREENSLFATISALDGTKAQSFNKQLCR